MSALRSLEKLRKNRTSVGSGKWEYVDAGIDIHGPCEGIFGGLINEVQCLFEVVIFIYIDLQF